MAEITISQGPGKSRSGFVKAKKHMVHIDMTPMVDLGFLLITFFIFTSAMSLPTTMSLIMPKESGTPTPVKESGSLTIIPGGNARFSYYEGSLKPESIIPSTLKEIRNVIISKKSRTPEKNFVVIIKPSERSSYKDIVDVLDEMTINNVKRYALVDISEEERKYFN